MLLMTNYAMFFRTDIVVLILLLQVIFSSNGNIAMRFAIATAYLDAEIFKALLSLSWKPAKLFTHLDEMKNCRTQAIDIAQSERINIQLSRITTADLKALADQGCDILVVAG